MHDCALLLYATALFFSGTTSAQPSSTPPPVLFTRNNGSSVTIPGLCITADKCPCQKFGDGTCDSECQGQNCNADGEDCRCNSPPQPATYKADKINCALTAPFVTNAACIIQCAAGAVAVNQKTGLVEVNPAVLCVGSGVKWKSDVLCETSCAAPPTFSTTVVASANCANPTPSRGECRDYTCASGLIKNAAAFWKCENGVWVVKPQGTTPLCEKTCPTVPSIPNGRAYCSGYSTTTPAPPGTACAYGCDSGYYQKGILLCTDGNWNIGDTCVKSCSSPPPTQPAVGGGGGVSSTSKPEVCLQVYAGAHLHSPPGTIATNGSALTGNGCAMYCDNRYQTPQMGCRSKAVCKNAAWDTTDVKCYIPCNVADLNGKTNAYACVVDEPFENKCVELPLAGATSTTPNLVSHGTQCILNCPVGSAYRGGSSGPYCYNGKWQWTSRRGHPLVIPTCKAHSTPTTPPTNPAYAACTTAPPKPASGSVKITECGGPYKHGLSFDLECNTGLTLIGETFVQCVNGVWAFGGKTTGTPSASCLSIECPTLDEKNVENAEPGFKCEKYKPGETCEVKCAAGFTPSFTRTNTSNLYSWWNMGYKCGAGGNWDTTTAVKCISACEGSQTAPHNTPGICQQQNLCDHFCSYENDKVDCTGPACSYDSKCPPISGVEFKALITQISVSYTLDRNVPSNAWIATYNVGETDHYNWLEAAFLPDTAATAVGGKHTITMRSGAESPRWSKGEIEARIFVDMSWEPPIATEFMCRNSITKCPTASHHGKLQILEANLFDSSNATVYQQEFFSTTEPDTLAFGAYSLKYAATYPVDVYHTLLPNQHVTRSKFDSLALSSKKVNVPDACIEAGCSCDLYGNGQCDAACNIAVCRWDAFDCHCTGKPVLNVANVEPNSLTCAPSTDAAGQFSVANAPSAGWLYDIKSNCTYKCKANFTTKTSTTSGSVAYVTCNPSGPGGVWTWDQCQPSCTTVPSPVPPGVQAATLNGPACFPKQYGATCDGWQCAPGFKKNDKASLECEANGQWSVKDGPPCQNIVYCPNAPAIANLVTTSCVNVSDGGSCVVGCPTGFDVVGGSTLTCKGTGWINPPTCAPECRLDPSVLGLTPVSTCITGGSAAVNSLCSMRCIVNEHTPWECSTRMKCGITGANWTSEAPNGTPRCYKDCPCNLLAAVVSNGTCGPNNVVSIRHAQTVNVVCNTGTTKDATTAPGPYCFDGQFQFFNPQGETLKPTQCVVGGSFTPPPVSAACVITTCDKLTVVDADPNWRCPGNRLPEQMPPESSCPVKCKPGYVPAFKHQAAGAKQPWVWGPVCSKTGKWENIPKCVPACGGNKADTDQFYVSPGGCTNKLECDWFCSVDTTTGGNPDCAGPACEWDSGLCDPPRATMEIKPQEVKLEWDLKRPLTRNAWIGFYPLTEVNPYKFSYAKFIPKDTHTNGKHIMTVNTVTEVKLTTDMEVRMYADAGLQTAPVIAKQTICSGLQPCAAKALTILKGKLRSQPSVACLQTGCRCDVYNDGVCDGKCNSKACEWDGGDCGCMAPPSYLDVINMQATTCGGGPNALFAPGTPCPFTCLDLHVAFNTLGQQITETTCKWHPNLYGARWEPMRCERPCLVEPTSTSPGVTFNANTLCRNTRSRTKCGFQCPTVLHKLGGEVLCKDGTWDVKAVCHPPCPESTIPVVGGAGTYITCGNGTGTGQVAVDTKCQYTCPTGYEVCGETICTTTGWKPGANCCAVVTGTCAKTALDNLISNGSPASVCPDTVQNGGVCDFQCNRWYTKAGEARCTRGTWISTARCLPPCEVDPPVHGSPTTCTDNIKKVAVGETCDNGCEPGWVKSTCTANPICTLNGTSDKVTINMIGRPETICMDDIKKAMSTATAFPTRRIALSDVTKIDSKTVNVTYQLWGLATIGQGGSLLSRLATAIAGGQLLTVNITQQTPWNRGGGVEIAPNAPAWDDLHHCYRYCMARELLNKANVAGCVEGDRILHGSRCTVKCNTGYIGVAIGTSSGVVQPQSKIGKPLCYDGTFIGAQIACVVPKPAPCCKWEDLPVVQHAMPYTDCENCYNTGYQLTVQCLPGFALTPVESKVICDSEGKWIFSKGAEPLCSATCPPLNVVNAAAIDMCTAVQPGGTCIFDCKKGYTPMWPDANNNNQWEYGPICSTNLMWINVPECREQCEDASKCEPERLCDKVCALDEGSLDCGGPSCDWDSKTCDPIAGSISILPSTTFKLSYHVSTPLPSTAWLGIFNVGEQKNFIWTGELHDLGGTTSGDRTITVATATVNRWNGGDLEARIYADAGNTRAIAKATICSSLEKATRPVDLSSGKKDAGAVVTGVAGCSGVGHDCKDGEILTIFGVGFNTLLAASNVVSFTAGTGGGLKDDGSGPPVFCRDTKVQASVTGPTVLCTLTVPTDTQGTWLVNVRVNGSRLDGNPTMHVADLSWCGKQDSKCASRCETQCTQSGKCGMLDFECDLDGKLPKTCVCANGVQPKITDTNTPTPTPGGGGGGPVSCAGLKKDDACNDGQSVTALDRCVLTKNDVLVCIGTDFRSSVIVVKLPGETAAFNVANFRLQTSKKLAGVDIDDVSVLLTRNLVKDAGAAEMEVAFQILQPDLNLATQEVANAINQIQAGGWADIGVPTQTPQVFSFDYYDNPVVPTSSTLPSVPTPESRQPPTANTQAPVNVVPAPAPDTDKDEDDKSISGGAVVGILIGIGAAIVLAGLGAFAKHTRKQRKLAEAAQYGKNPLTNDGLLTNQSDQYSPSFYGEEYGGFGSNGGYGDFGDPTGSYGEFAGDYFYGDELSPTNTFGDATYGTPSYGGGMYGY